MASQPSPTRTSTPRVIPISRQTGLHSAVIRIVGFTSGQRIQGFLAAASSPWKIETAGCTLLNIDSVEDPSNPGSFLFVDGFYAAPTNNAALNAIDPAARWDSGLIGSSTFQPNPSNFGAPADSDAKDDIGGFALFADGSGEDVAPAFWLSSSPNGIPAPIRVNGLGVMRVTWRVGATIRVSFVLAMHTPAQDIPLSLTIPSTSGTAACCLPDGSCVMNEVGNCYCLGGKWDFVNDCASVECAQPCPADLTGDGQVNVSDLLGVIGDWGATSGPADVNGDGIVNVGDLLEVIGAWGPCP